jgi:hypothetical protein
MTSRWGALLSDLARCQSPRCLLQTAAASQVPFEHDRVAPFAVVFESPIEGPVEVPFARSPHGTRRFHQKGDGRMTWDDCLGCCRLRLPPLLHRHFRTVTKTYAMPFII